jgi:hypothetical protein
LNDLNILVAYPYLKPNVIAELEKNKQRVRFLLDSGAFTAWKSGKEIHVDEYCKFIESLPTKPWRYFTLDKIGDPEGSLKNYEIMLSRGFNPIPIFTRGEDIKMIDHYYKTSDVVGIGGLVGTQGNKGFVKGIMKIIGDRKAHWLGFNSKEFISHYKPYMCDSSSWSAAVRYASVKLYDKNGKWYHVTKKDFASKPPKHILDLISSYGIDPKRMGQAAQWKNSGRGDYALEVLGCRSWTRYQIDLKNKLDVNFFLACASNWQIKLMCDSHKFWEDR